MPSGLTPAQMKEWWAEFNGGFINMKFPLIMQLVSAIQHGHAYTAQHNRYRKATNFICGQHVALDFDTGDYRSSFDYLLQDDFIKNHAAVLHTTSSHTAENPRARAIFILEYPIYKVDKYSLLTEAFAQTYSDTAHADKSCKDPVRIFFGSEGCDVNYLGNRLSVQDAADKIVLPYKEKLRIEKEHMSELFAVNRRVEHVNLSYLEAIKESLLDKISAAPDGSKHTTLVKIARTFGGYVAAGYFNEEEVKQLMFSTISARPTTRNINVAWNAIEFGVDSGKTEPLYLQEDEDIVLRKLFLQ